MTSATRARRIAQHAVSTALCLVVLVLAPGGTALAETPTPVATPGVVPTTPSHGSWPAVAIVLGFLAAGAGTLVLAHRRTRSPRL